MNRRPDHRVTLQRRANGFLPETISADIISISITKSYGKSAGGFALVLTFRRAINGQRYDQAIKPNDVIHIELDAGDGTGLQSRMIGLVSRAARTVTVGNDQVVTRRAVIHGQDFGKILNTHTCTADITPGVGKIGPEKALRQIQGLQFKGTPHTLCKSIFEKLLINQLPWVAKHIEFSNDNPQPTYNENSFSPAGLTTTTDRDNWETYAYTILDSQGPVWDAMKQAANEPYNVLTTETYDGKVSVTLEKYPFSGKDGKLTRQKMHIIRNDDITSEDLGIDDSDVVNYLWYKCYGLSILSGNASLAVFYPDAICKNFDSIQDHGFRPFMPTTNFTPPGGAGNWIKAFKDRSRELWNWHKNSPDYESGTLTIKGNPHVKAGSGVIHEPTGMEYFVEGYTEAYTWGEKYLTTLQLTRGQKHES